jgi:hypothetical protein
MPSDRGYLEAILLASLLLLGAGYLTATSADEQEQAVDLSFLNGDWDFNGLEAFVRPEAKTEAKTEARAKTQARHEAKNSPKNSAKN